MAFLSLLLSKLRGKNIHIQAKYMYVVASHKV